MRPFFALSIAALALTACTPSTTLTPDAAAADRQAVACVALVADRRYRRRVRRPLTVYQ